jgi:arylsulfatase A-like enzyme
MKMACMDRREFMTACGAALLPGVLPAASPKHPNILFVFADQLRSMELGCYGGTQVHTPHMDRLAREGALFTNAVSTYPVCSPFRAMLMTGNFPMKNGMVMNDHFLRNPTPCFAEVCKVAGYRTGYIGKWHIDGRGRQAYIPPERRLGFDVWRALECTHNYSNSKYYLQDEKTPRSWSGYDAIAQTDAACAFIEQSSSSTAPFCLFLSWGPPHDPYKAPKKYMQRFDPEQIKLRDNVNDFVAAQSMRAQCDTALTPQFTKTRRAFAAKLMDRSNTAIRQWYQGYYAAIEALDDCLGKLNQTLAKQGILENTLFVFTSDHGDNLGSHRQYGKQLPYEESISIPFVLRYPRKIPEGTQTDALLAPVDMMPTLLSLAEIPCPAVDGKDISPAAMGKDADLQDAVLIMRLIWLGTNWITNGSGPWRGVRTKRYTYARKADTGKPWLLFDNKQDPQQLNNLIADPAQADLIDKLNAKTNELLAAAADPEDPMIIAEQIKKECQAQGVPTREQVLFPARVQAGSGFRGL